MCKEYSPDNFEKKWQDIWDAEQPFKAESKSDKPKFYALVEFPYPSGEGLHVGHPRPYTAMDMIARKRRMEGYNVLFPIGWDAFGLPTENYAIKNRIHPRIVTQNNINRFRGQLKRIGFSFDYSREVNTTDPNYYRWTQWIFLRLLEKGLAYKAHMNINWCTSCKVGLANEEVVGGACERCGGEVTHKQKSQWMLKITDYAQRLLDGLDSVDYIERVKRAQINWIGRSEGAEVDFSVQGADMTLRVFTTRPDTLFGATYMVISPEHPLITDLAGRIENIGEINDYKSVSAKKSDFERSELNKEKTGVEIKGIKAVNPVNGQPIPIWTSDYVLMGYGTGAIMAVPGHDERDYEFAKKFGLPIVEVVAGGNITEEAYTDIDDGVMVNSGFLNGMKVEDAKKAITAFLAEKGLGEGKINYKLRDWVFARQRYWGEPIPVIWCDDCGCVPLNDEDLPLVLPEVENYMPTDTGESPLSAIDDWVNVPCPNCGKPAKRETDTMPQWAGSSWYFLRYMDPDCDEAFASKEALEYWQNVDWYNGGMEHATLHLLYSRFWHQFLYDIGAVPTPEPYAKRTAHAFILGANGEKMSKSRGNVINPDDVIKEIGADAFRTYVMFMGAFDQEIPWSTNGAKGCRRFLERVWRLQEMLTEDEGVSADMKPALHAMIKKVSEDIERMKFNTAIAAMMSFVNDIYAKGSITKGELKAFLPLLSTCAPHIAEELWHMVTKGAKGLVCTQSWPQYDPAALKQDEVEIAVQVLGKLRARLMLPTDATQEQAREIILANETIASLVEGKSIKKFIYIPGRLANIVV
ncbi:MAG: leucine--tRNA ligase [Christensenellales bacterium]|jgi:leucyl-tRNA synthetase